MSNIERKDPSEIEVRHVPMSEYARPVSTVDIAGTPMVPKWDYDRVARQLAGAVSLLGEAATGLREAADLVAGGNVERDLRALAARLDTAGGQ